MSYELKMKNKLNQLLQINYINSILFFILTTVTIIMPINYNLGLFIIILLFLNTLLRYKEVYIPQVYYLILFGYFLIILFSKGNPVLHIDFKYHLAFFMIFITFDQFQNKVKNLYKTIFRIAFWVSSIVFIIYILMYFNILKTNIFFDNEIPEYQAFRIYGPPLGVFLLLPMLYSMQNFQKDLNTKYIYITFVMGSITAALSGSNQSLVLLVSFYLISIVSLSFQSLKFLVIIPLVLIIASSNLSEKHTNKIQQIFNPSESQTLITRMNDLSYAYNELVNKDYALFLGEGIGVSTEVERVSWDGKRYSFSEFLEIDNGFFYVLHRLGIVGLIAYISMFLLLIYKFGSIKNKFMYILYFIITNLLSIHFFTSIFSALLTYILIKDKK